jgi:hypothetical protein
MLGSGLAVQHIWFTAPGTWSASVKWLHNWDMILPEFVTPRRGTPSRQRPGSHDLRNEVMEQRWLKTGPPSHFMDFRYLLSARPMP